MKLRDVEVKEREVFKEKIAYATNRIAEIRHEISLHKEKIRELERDIKTLNNTEISEIQLPLICDPIWLGTHRIR